LIPADVSESLTGRLSLSDQNFFTADTWKLSSHADAHQSC